MRLAYLSSAAPDAVYPWARRLIDDLNRSGGAGGGDVSPASADAAGTMSATDFVKLFGIEPNATANSDDAFLLDRGHHTGTQRASTISDLPQAVDGRVVSLLTQGAGVGLVYNPADNTLTISSTAVGSFNGRGGAVTLTSGDVTGALGFTPYNATNPAGYITGITSANVTTALGYTPTSVTGLTGAQTVAAFKTGLSINNLDNTADAAKPISTAQATALALKADLASPALTGTPTAPTAADATSNTQLATTAFVHSLITGIINASPATLDTLKELADAIGDDPNFATTVASSVATKLTKASNLSDLTNAATARTNMGVAIGTNVQAWDADLDAIAALSATALFWRSAANVWTAVTYANGVTFSGGALGLGAITPASIGATGGSIGSQTASAALFVITPSTSAAGGVTYTNSWSSGGQGPTIFAHSAGEVGRFTSTGNFTTAGSITATGTVAGSNLSGTNTGDQYTSIATATLIGNNSGSTGAATVLTATTVTAMLNAMVGATVSVAGTKGLVPAPAAGDHVKYLTGAGTYTLVSLTTGVTGTLPVANGGTGRTTAYPVLNAYRNGTTAFQTIGQSFTTIVLNTVQTDPASGYSTSTGLYTVPETGNYLAIGRVKLVDAATAAVNYGIGVDTSNSDSQAFMWTTTIAATSGSGIARNGHQVMRYLSLTAGQTVRLFMYGDVAAGLGVAAAELTLYRLP